jgi:hypothetical protein
VTRLVEDALAVAAERLGTRGHGVLARLGGPFGHAVRAVHGELGRLDVGARKRRRADVVARTRAPVPPGLRAVHPTWIEHGLAALPARARQALAAGATTPVDVWLARWATAALPPIVARDRDVAAWLANIGADQFALALGEQARKIPALVAAAARIEQSPRVGQLGPTRAALARCRGLSLGDELAFVRVGSRALAPHLAADQLARLQLVMVLPRAIGVVVARELRAHAATSFDQCPTWAALCAH